MVIIDDYLNYHNRYTKIYGSQTIILMQVGSFFEVYGTPTEGPDMKYLANILDIQYTKKDKGIEEVSRKNHYLLGFPLYTLQKFIDILINNHFTIVLIEQVTQPPEPKREVTQIISPATYTEFQKNPEMNNFLMSVYFSKGKDRLTNSLIIMSSISWVDVVTNESFIIETNDLDSKINIEDTLKTIINNNPSEIIIFCENGIDYKLLRDFVSCIPSNICIHDKTMDIINENYFKLSYQTTVLNKVFDNTGLLSVIEYLDLEMKHNAIICFTYLIQFVYEHNEKILNGIKKPVFMENNKYLQLINNALTNLNIISNNSNSKTSSVINLLNNCKTNIGKRFFKKCLIHPLINSQHIQERYDQCESFIKNGFYDLIRIKLINVCDIERLYKRILMKTLQPPEMNGIYSTFNYINDIIYMMSEKEFDLINIYSWSGEKQVELTNLIDYMSRYDFNEMDKVNTNQIIRNLFKNGIYPELDELQNEIFILENIFENVVECLNFGCDSEFKLTKNKDNIKSISVTTNRFQNLLKDKSRSLKINNLLKEKCNLSIDDISSKPLSAQNKNNLKISFKGMDENQVKLSELQTEFRNKVIQVYMDELTYIYDNFKNLFIFIIDFIGKIDFYTTNAYNSKKYCLRKPEIDEQEYGYIKANKIRHILIENIQTDIPYIANDIEIGYDKKGMLLYSYNGAGKSSLLKSVGNSLIMAQSGCYVPCDSFIYSPYTKIFSRIPSSDNLRQSLFQVEVSELRTIIKKSDRKSLVISDELCSGTENISALSLISSSIDFMSRNEISFLMATHLHDLTDISVVKNAKNVSVYHLQVTCDENNDLVYNRILKEGQGSREYGLEVCKSLDLPSEFLLCANKIKQELKGYSKTIVPLKPSVYNNTVFFDMCSICNKKTEEIHHIIEQHKSNENGIIEEENIHKNRKSNLINVCSCCHDDIHLNKIKVNGYKQTSNGIKLDYEKNIFIIEDDDLDIRVKDLKKEGKSLKTIFNIISDEFKNEKITMYKIKKILT